MPTTPVSFVEFSVGAAFIVLHTMVRFNNPRTNRSSTTAIQYYVSALSYAGLAFLLYAALALFPNITANLAALAKDDELNWFVEKWSEHSPALLAALFIGVAVPKLPPFREMDRWVRERFQRMASIPFEVQRMTEELSRAKFEFSEDQEIRVRNYLLGRGFDEADVVTRDDGSPQFLWTKTIHLFLELEERRTSRDYRIFYEDFADEYDSLVKRIESNTHDIRTYFASLHADAKEAGPMGKARDKDLAKFHTQYRGFITKQIKRINEQVCLLISRQILLCAGLGSARSSAIETMGFRVEWPDRLSVHHIVAIFAVIFGTIIVAGMVMLREASGADDNPQATFRQLLPVLIALSQCFAVGCVLFLRPRLKIARQHYPGERTYAFYILVGLIAALFGLLLGIAFRSLAHMDLLHGLQTAWPKSPWVLLPFTTAVVTAFQLDHTKAHQRRLTETLLQCLALVVAVAFVVHIGLPYTGGEISGGGTWRPFLLSAIIGAVIGATVPHMYRRERQRQERSQSAAPMAVANAA